MNKLIFLKVLFNSYDGDDDNDSDNWPDDTVLTE
jgi:hypothetical protein